MRIQSAHSDVVNRILAAIPDQERAGFPVRFIVQSGDAVVAGQYGNQWNVSFNPLIERLIHEDRCRTCSPWGTMMSAACRFTVLSATLD